MSYTEDQVKAMLSKSDEFHQHAEEHLKKIIKSYQQELAIAVDALETLKVAVNDKQRDIGAVNFIQKTLEKIRGER